MKGFFWLKQLAERRSAIPSDQRSKPVVSTPSQMEAGTLLIIVLLFLTTPSAASLSRLLLNRFNMPAPNHLPTKEQHSLDDLDPNTTIVARCQCRKAQLNIPLHGVLPLKHKDSYRAAVDCHCPACRKYHVSAFASYLLARQVDIEGDDHTSDSQTPTNNANIQTYRDACVELGPVLRLQCQSCRTKLATRPLRVDGRHGHQWLVNLGSVDDRTIPRPLTKFLRAERRPWQWDRRAVWYQAAALADDDDEEAHNEDYYSLQRDKHDSKNNALTKPQSANTDRCITGSCACGQSKYRIHWAPESATDDHRSLLPTSEIQHCYCRLCRRLSGGPFQTWVPFAKEDFEWVTTGSDNDDNTAKPPPQQQYVSFGKRHVCGNCGGVLTIVYRGQEDMIWPAAGGFDDDSLPFTTEEMSQHLHTVMHISCRYKQSWYTLPKDGNPRIQEAGE